MRLLIFDEPLTFEKIKKTNVCRGHFLISADENSQNDFRMKQIKNNTKKYKNNKNKTNKKSND